MKFADIYFPAAWDRLKVQDWLKGRLDVLLYTQLLNDKLVWVWPAGKVRLE